MSTDAVQSGGMQLKAGLRYQLVLHFACFSTASRGKRMVGALKQAKTLSSLHIRRL